MSRNDYSESDSLDSAGEKFLSLHIYVLRKLVLAAVLLLVGVASRLSKVFGFNFSVSVSDREAWRWELHEKIPLYRAQVERVD